MKKLTLLLALLFVGTSTSAQSVKSLADYKAEAEAAVDGTTSSDTMRLKREDAVVLVDIRDSAEVEKSGTAAGAIHVPRGMLEFYIDPKSPMHKNVFRTEKKVVFYCETGGRSLLAAKLAKDMGVTDASYLIGGYRAWTKAGGDTTK